MLQERFEINTNGYRFRGAFGYTDEKPENALELIGCVLKNLKGSPSTLCCSGNAVADALRDVSSICHVEIEDVSVVKNTAVSAKKENPTLPAAEHVAESTVKTEWVCVCGKKNNDNFCTMCGKKRPVRPEFCTACGKKLGKDDIFCGGCGKRI